MFFMGCFPYIQVLSLSIIIKLGCLQNSSRRKCTYRICGAKITTHLHGKSLLGVERAGFEGDNVDSEWLTSAFIQFEIKDLQKACHLIPRDLSGILVIFI